MAIVKTSILVVIVAIFLFCSSYQSADKVLAQYGSSCSDYGIMAYESGGYCKCMSGYVMGEGILGDTQCVSANSICTDEYGYAARYDSLSDSCECNYGYVLGKDSIGRTQCITDDEACRNQLGYNSRATYGGQCECSYGHVIDGGQCVDGDRVCRQDHGIYASYDSLSNKCECDSGYTFDEDNQCVKKHNSAYFTLLDISENGDELLVQSQHDFQNYILEYGIGCWDYAIESYEGMSMVINMGTDFTVDLFDTIVLQNHDQTCSIMNVDRTFDDSFPEPDEENYSQFYIAPVTSHESQPDIGESQSPQQSDETLSVEAGAKIDLTVSTEAEIQEDETSEHAVTNTDDHSTLATTSSDATATVPSEKPSLVSRVVSFFKSIFFK